MNIVKEDANHQLRGTQIIGTPEVVNSNTHGNINGKQHASTGGIVTDSKEYASSEPRGGSIIEAKLRTKAEADLTVTARARLRSRTTERRAPDGSGVAPGTVIILAAKSCATNR